MASFLKRLATRGVSRSDSESCHIFYVYHIIDVYTNRIYTIQEISVVFPSLPVLPSTTCISHSISLITSLRLDRNSSDLIFAITKRAYHSKLFSDSRMKLDKCKNRKAKRIPKTICVKINSIFFEVTN